MKPISIMLLNQTSIGVILFALGFSINWLILNRNYGDVGKSPISVMQDTKSTRTLRQRSSANRIQDYLEKIRQAEMSGDRELITDAYNRIPNIAIPALIPALVEEFKKRSSIDGMDYRQRWKVADLVCQWYQQDADSALAWLKSIAPKEDAIEFLDSILEFEADRDWDRAIELAENFGSKGNTMPSGWRDKLSNCDALTLGKIFTAFSEKDRDKSDQMTVSFYIDFQKDFDFAAFAKIFSENGGDNYGINNFNRSWAKKDPRAAWKWVTENTECPWNSSFDETYAGARDIHGVALANSLLAETMNNEPDSQKKYDLALKTLPGNDNPDELSNLISQLGGDRMAHLEGLIDTTIRSTRSYSRGLTNSIIGAMTPDERAQLLPKVIQNVSDNEIREDISFSLYTLGYNLDEIGTLLPPVKESP